MVISRTPKVPYSALLEQLGLDTLASHRQKLSLTFGTEVLNSTSLRSILPLNFKPHRERPTRAVAEAVSRIQPINVSRKRYLKRFVF